MGDTKRGKDGGSRGLSSQSGDRVSSVSRQSTNDSQLPEPLIEAAAQPDSTWWPARHEWLEQADWWPAASCNSLSPMWRWPRSSKNSSFGVLLGKEFVSPSATYLRFCFNTTADAKKQTKPTQMNRATCMLCRYANLISHYQIAVLGSISHTAVNMADNLIAPETSW